MRTTTPETARFKPATPRLALVLVLACTLGSITAAHGSCLDERATVFFGDYDTGVPNRATGPAMAPGCVNDRILDDQEYSGVGAFLRHVSQVAFQLKREGVLSLNDVRGLLRAVGPSEIGRMVTLQILALNDFHGNLEPPSGGVRVPDPADPTRTVTVPAGGVEYLASHVTRLKRQSPHSVVVSAGDLIGASPLLSALFHDEPTVDAMNLLGLEFNAVGNHEFDEGRTELLRMQAGGCHPVDGCLDGDGFAGADFRFLAANVVDTQSGRTLFPPYAVKSYGGVKVAFVGMTLEGTPTIVTPSGVAGLEFRDEADTVNALIPELKRQGVEAVVMLLHEGAVTTGGFNECTGASGAVVDIVRRLDPEVDVVITGHTHQAYNCVLDGRLVTSAGSFGRLLTEVRLTLDRASRDVRTAVAENLIVTREVEKDAAETALIAKYQAIAAPLAGRVIGAITATLTRTANDSGESALGGVIADAQLAATRAPQFGAAQIAFMNPGGVRADLDFPASGTEGDGQVTYGEAFTVQPFGNSLVTMRLSGAQIKILLEQQFTGCTNNQPFDRILQVSDGFTYAWDAGRPACERVLPGSILLNGQPVLPEGVYRVTVNSFLADGGDQFAVLREGTDRLGGALDLDALEVYLRERSPIAPPAPGRIQRLN